MKKLVLIRHGENNWNREMHENIAPNVKWETGHHRHPRQQTAGPIEIFRQPFE
nr:hypothetical protein [Geoalkalibacter subterraneus]